MTRPTTIARAALTALVLGSATAASGVATSAGTAGAAPTRGTGALAAPAAAAPSPRPNIVLLLADDWGFTDVGAYGGEIATPNLDALARAGARFSNFHVTASCSPTRAMLLTGVDNHLNGVGNMRETIPREHLGRPGYLTVLNTRVVTLATLLRDAGYRTYAVGKWHVGQAPHNLPDARGFDRSIVQADSGSDNWEPAKPYLELNDKVYWFEDGQPATMPAGYYSSRFFVDRAIAYLGGASTGAGQAAGAEGRADPSPAGSAAATTAPAQPFFAYIAFQANHIPLQAPREFIDRYRGRYDAGWTALREARRRRAAELGLLPAEAPMATMSTTLDWNARSPEQKRYDARRMEVYAGMAEAMDHEVGRLLDHLKRTGQYENTVFVFLSDNGAEASDPDDFLAGRLWLALNYAQDFDRLGGQGAYTVIGPSWASAAASPLATYKFYAGEGGLRVPLIVSGVHGMRPGALHHGFAHVSDIVPTLLDLAGVPRPGSTYRGQSIEPPRGASLLPVLRGEAHAAHAPDEVIGYELSGNQAVFKADLKLVRNLPPVGDGQWHLYDLRRDPGETRDLREAMPEAFRALQADYEAYAKANGVLPMPDGYEPRHQVLVNALLNVYCPRYRWVLLASLAVLFGVLGWMVGRRRRG